MYFYQSLVILKICLYTSLKNPPIIYFYTYILSYKIEKKTSLFKEKVHKKKKKKKKIFSGGGGGAAPPTLVWRN